MKTKILSIFLIFLLLSSNLGTLSFASSKLTAPTGVKAVAPDTFKIHIQWNAIKGATGYEIYRITDGKSRLLSKTSQTTYTDDDSIYSLNQYYYKVRAYALGGKKVTYGSFSPIVTVKTTVDAPNMLTADDLSSNRIQLNWLYVMDADGYQVFRAQSEKGKYFYLYTTTKTNYLDKTVKGNTIYFYKVRAYAVVNGKKEYSHSFSSVCSIQTIPSNKKYLHVLFIGNSLTSVPNTNGQFDALCKETGRYVKVHSIIALGAKLIHILSMLDANEYQYDRENADIVIFQEYGGEGNIDSTTAAIKQMMPYFKHAKFYYLPSCAYKTSLSGAKGQQFKGISAVKNFKTNNLAAFLFDQYPDTLFRLENDFHPNFLYGYASATLIYSTLFRVDPTKLPDDFFATSDLPKELQANRKAFFTYVRQAVKDALAVE